MTAHSMIGRTMMPTVVPALLMACLALAAQTPPASSGSRPLHSVRTIYVRQPDLWRAVEQADLLRSMLKKELQVAGFQIAEESPAADAVLAAGFCGESVTVVLDGDEWDPTYPRASYCFQLNSASGEQLWHSKVYVSKGQRLQGELREAALVCARKLSGARRKSAHKLGR